MDSAKRKYTNADEVYKRLEQYFAANPYAMGDRVPPERDLADHLKVNRTTLRSAMHRMVKEGVLERHVGRGTFFKASPSSILENYRQISMDCSPAELMELRMLLEPQLASMAVAHATGEHLQRVGQYAAQLESATHEMQLARDLELQELLAECVHNRLLQQLTELVASLRQRFDAHSHARFITGLGFEDIEHWRGHQHNICKALLQRSGKNVVLAIDAKLSDLFGQFSPAIRPEGQLLDR